MSLLVEKMMFDFDLTKEEAEKQCANTNVTEYESIEKFNEEFEFTFKTFEDFVNSSEKRKFTSIFYVIDGKLYMIHND